MAFYFEEAEHPRAGKGSPTGGQFVSKGGGAESSNIKAAAAPANKYGLSEEEETLLFDWTAGPETASFAPTKKGMDIKLRKSAKMGKVLEKLPVYEGTVYRGLELTAKQLAKYRIGAVIDMNLHSSATRNKMTAAKAAETWWSGTESVVMEIETKSGRAIPKAYTDFEHEREVVLLKGTRYKVTGKTEGKTTRDEEGGTVRHITIKMKEIVEVEHIKPGGEDWHKPEYDFEPNPAFKSKKKTVYFHDTNADNVDAIMKQGLGVGTGPLSRGSVWANTKQDFMDTDPTYYTENDAVIVFTGTPKETSEQGAEFDAIPLQDIVGVLRPKQAQQQHVITTDHQKNSLEKLNIKPGPDYDRDKAIEPLVKAGFKSGGLDALPPRMRVQLQVESGLEIPDKVPELQALSGKAFADALDDLDGTIMEGIKDHVGEIGVVYASYKPNGAAMTTVTGPGGAVFLINTSCDYAKTFTNEKEIGSYSARVGFDEFKKSGDIKKAVMLQSRLAAVHEFAHLADRVTDDGMTNTFIEAVMLESRADNARQLGQWMSKNISKYACASPKEAMAEAVSKYIHEGKLPGILNAWAKQVVGSHAVRRRKAA